MNARSLTMNVALVAIAINSLWCTSSDEAPGIDAGSDAPPGASDAGGADADAGQARCSDTFCRVPLPTRDNVTVNAILGRSAAEIWAVGSSGFVARFDGTSWKPVESGTKATIFGAAATKDGTVWGASSGAEFLELSREVDGSVVKVGAGFDGIVEGISAFGDEAYAVGRTNPSYDFPPPPPPYIWRYAGGADAEAPAWNPVSPACPMVDFEYVCPRLRAVWVESAERQWFAGDNGKVLRTDPDGGAPAGSLRLAEMNSSSLRKLNALWGFNGNDVWAVGDQGVIRHFAGGDAWTVVPSPTIANLHGVWGTRPDDVWAVGDDGTVIHWDGAVWAVKDVPFPLDERPALYGVGGVGDDVWIGGEKTTLLRSRATGADQ